MTDTITIWVSTYVPATGEQFTEAWQNYHPSVTEEEAIEEVWEVIDSWNATLHPGDHPREAISFVLELVEKEIE